eukprot:767734-Hanusia_phi.AAC.7
MMALSHAAGDQKDVKLHLREQTQLGEFRKHSLQKGSSSQLLCDFDQQSDNPKPRLRGSRRRRGRGSMERLTR